MISSVLHLVGLRPRVYYTLTNFMGGGGKAPPPTIRQWLQYVSANKTLSVNSLTVWRDRVMRLATDPGVMRSSHAAGHTTCALLVKVMAK